MNLIFRRMSLADVPVCHSLSLWGDFMFDMPRLDRLPDLWRQLVRERACVSFVVEDADRPPGERLMMMEIAAFLTPEFAGEVRRGLPPYLPRQIVDRAVAGRSPLLDLNGVRAANAGCGLTTLCLFVATRLPLFDPENALVAEKALEAYIAFGSGYHYREVLVEAYGREQARWNLNTGMCLRTDYADDWGRGARPLHQEGLEPYLLGVTEEELSSSQGSLLHFHFRWQPPRFYFTPREQELLDVALTGQSDEEVARSLCVARVTLRKRWEAIYQKVIRDEPDLLSGRNGRSSGEDSLVGPEQPTAQKKRLLLTYLRNHPEELRPISPLA